METSPTVDTNTNTNTIEIELMPGVGITVEVGERAAGGGAAVTTSKPPTYGVKLRKHVVHTFNELISTAAELPDGSYSVDIHYPDPSFYDGCIGPKGHGEFIPIAHMANHKTIASVHSQIVKDNPDLASTHSIKIVAKIESVEFLVRPRPVDETASAVAATGSPRSKYQAILDAATQSGHPFPTENTVRADLAAAVPHQEGLSRSTLYTVGSDKDGVELFCRRLGLKYCITASQPKEQGLIRFRIFAQDKVGFVKAPKVAGGGGRSV
ncbi:hypothetical protein EBR43_10910 [bacterium]|nr:hypothetical protein [bacterium]